MQFNKEDIDIGERLRNIREGMYMTREEFSEKNRYNRFILRAN